jgi:hypothetical protein
MIKNFKNYRFILWNNNNPGNIFYCFSNTDVTKQTGLNRSAQYKLLNGQPINKHNSWTIVKTRLPVILG